MDKERLENPLVPPLSRNMYTQKHGLESIPKHAVPINIKTRGDGGDYQQIGILYKEDIANNENNLEFQNLLISAGASEPDTVTNHKESYKLVFSTENPETAKKLGAIFQRMGIDYKLSQ